MLKQGTYGLSRGNTLEGVPRSAKVLNFVTIYDSALCWEPLNIDWIFTWTSYPELEPLTEKEWLLEG